MSARMSAAELRDLREAGGARGNRRVRGARHITVDGITFDSRAEAARWAELQTLRRAGAISDLRRQVRIGLEGRDGPIMTDGGGRQRVWVADFVYTDHALGRLVIEDRKGYATEVFRLKRAILAAQGVEVLVT